MQVVVGRIGRAHGVHGDVSVEVRTDEPELRFAPGAVLTTDSSGHEALTVTGVRQHSGRTLVHFEQVNDRTAAEQLRGVRLMVEVDPDLRPDDPDEYYDRQLVGLAVLDSRHGLIGHVAEVVHLPGQELLAVDRAAPARQVLVPFVSAIVTGVDLAAAQLTVDLPPGLLELADE